jgi:hypothetical protein
MPPLRRHPLEARGNHSSSAGRLLKEFFLLSGDLQAFLGKYSARILPSDKRI